MTTSKKENLQVSNAKQKVATHSQSTAKDQVRMISSDKHYTIADVSFQSAPAQQPTNQPQELSSVNQVTKRQSKSSRKTQGSAKPKKTKPTHRSFPSQRTAIVTGKINDCPTKLHIDSGALSR